MDLVKARKSRESEGTKNREVSFPGMGNFMQAPWKQFIRMVAVGDWIKDEEAQTSSEINLRKKR